MAKCKHDAIRVDVSITREIAAIIDLACALVIENAPNTLKINVECRQCNYRSVFTLYPNRADGYGWSRWPKWLLRRMDILRRESPAVDEVLLAFEFDNLRT